VTPLVVLFCYLLLWRPCATIHVLCGGTLSPSCSHSGSWTIQRRTRHWVSVRNIGGEGGRRRRRREGREGVSGLPQSRSPATLRTLPAISPPHHCHVHTTDTVHVPHSPTEHIRYPDLIPPWTGGCPPRLQCDYQWLLRLRFGVGVPLLWAFCCPFPGYLNWRHARYTTPPHPVTTATAHRTHHSLPTPLDVERGVPYIRGTGWTAAPLPIQKTSTIMVIQRAVATCRFPPPPPPIAPHYHPQHWAPPHPTPTRTLVGQANTALLPCRMRTPPVPLHHLPYLTFPSKHAARRIRALRTCRAHTPLPTCHTLPRTATRWPYDNSLTPSEIAVYGATDARGYNTRFAPTLRLTLLHVLLFTYITPHLDRALPVAGRHCLGYLLLSPFGRLSTHIAGPLPFPGHAITPSCPTYLPSFYTVFPQQAAVLPHRTLPKTPCQDFAAFPTTAGYSFPCRHFAATHALLPLSTYTPQLYHITKRAP